MTAMLNSFWLPKEKATHSIDTDRLKRAPFGLRFYRLSNNFDSRITREFDH
jgi:hypothetical protein